MPLVSKTFSDIITFTRASTGTYFNSAGTLTSAAINEPRLDYNPSTLAAQGLLIEEARSNLVLYSDQFDNAVWGKANATVTANAIASPDGTVNADKLVETTATGEHYARQNFVGLTASANYTTSIYIKAGGRTAGQIRILDTDVVTNGYYVNFNLTAVTVSTLAVGTGSTVLAGSIVNAGGGWYRIVVTGSITGTKYTLDTFIQNPAGTQSYTGDGTSGIYLWGAQLEAGSFATSYIPTTTTALTRAADVANVNTLSPWYNASEGTIYGEFLIPFAMTSLSTPRIASFLGAGGSNVDEIFLFLSQAAGKAASGNVFTASVNAGLVDASASFVANTIIKSAYAVKPSDRAITTAGATPGTSATAFTMPTVTSMGLGQAASVFSLNGWLRRLTYWPRRLSNAELQSITT